MKNNKQNRRNSQKLICPKPPLFQPVNLKQEGSVVGGVVSSQSSSFYSYSRSETINGETVTTSSEFSSTSGELPTEDIFPVAAFTQLLERGRDRRAQARELANEIRGRFF